MNLYPAIRATMGRWTYFIVKLTMREVQEQVKFAHDIHQDHTLDDAIQRIINESRVKQEIVAYLQRQQDRFFSSLVVAALEGNPVWYPISIADDPKFEIFRDDPRLASAFGVLKFDGTQKYYALDGQHRLSAIRTLLDPKAGDEWRNTPAGFANEEISVIVVMPTEADHPSDFFKRYRRLFGNLNRYAKPTSHFTNIVMDEDDTFAILTRRLITEHEFFMAKEAPYRQSPRIKMRKGKNVTKQSSVFTSLETLYAMNKHLLNSAKRLNAGWKDKTFTAFRLDDDELDQLFEELSNIWNNLILVLPALRNNPASMRCHSRESEKGCPHRTQGDKCDDSALFWPVTQELVAKLARQLLGDSTSVSEHDLKPLAGIDWSLRRPPWRNLLLIPDGSDSWKMRNEERPKAVVVVERILMWQLGIVSLDNDDIKTLREEWEFYLLHNVSDDKKNGMWTDIESSRSLG